MTKEQVLGMSNVSESSTYGNLDVGTFKVRNSGTFDSSKGRELADSLFIYEEGKSTSVKAHKDGSITVNNKRVETIEDIENVLSVIIKCMQNYAIK